MESLTVRQPWAWAILHGGKNIENRTRNIAGSYRGPVAIHAGKALDVAAFSSPLITPVGAVSSWRASYPDGEARLSWPTAGGRVGVRLILGAIIGVVDLVDVHLASRRGAGFDGEQLAALIGTGALSGMEVA
jgi:hypothetical protein